MIERFYWWLAFDLPQKVAYFAAVRIAAHATQGEWSGQVVPDLTAMDALQRWEKAAA